MMTSASAGQFQWEGGRGGRYGRKKNKKDNFEKLLIEGMKGYFFFI